jgi:hypothetical protein
LAVGENKDLAHLKGARVSERERDDCRNATVLTCFSAASDEPHGTTLAPLASPLPSVSWSHAIGARDRTGAPPPSSTQARRGRLAGGGVPLFSCCSMIEECTPQRDLD